MTDTTNDIDALLAYLAAHSRFGFHSPLIALVAERDALKRRVEELESHNSVAVRLLLAERDGLREQLRLANIDQFNTEAESNDRELRERLVCAIWPELLRIYEKADETGGHWDLVRSDARSRALREADEMIAAMRKGVTDGK